jgi:hypothetical protein
MMVNKVTLQIYEVINKAAKTVKKADKIQVLKQNDSFALRTILQGTYNPNIVFSLPEGEPPYTENKPQSVPSTLHKQARMLGYFVESSQMTQIKKERKFIELLEAIHPQDAKIVLQMKDKKPFKGISSVVVKEAFPSILP